MNKMMIIIIDFIFALLFLNACENNLEHNIVPDKIYVVNNGLTHVIVKDVEMFNYEMNVVKSGFNKTSSKVNLTINSSLLVDYNISHKSAYKVLPEDCYKIVQDEIEVSKSQYQTFFPITFNITKIKELQGVGNIQYVLPCAINVVKDELKPSNENQLTTLIAIEISSNDGNIGKTTVWNFDSSPKDWEHNNVSDSPDLIVYKDGMLRISTQAGTEQRKKAYTKSWEHAQGKYQWRIFVSDLGIGEKCSIGAFLYKDDQHELDFEIASGNTAARAEYDAKDDELLVYMTSQGNPWFQKIVKIKKNKWYTFEIDLKLINGSYQAKWSIDGENKAEKQLDFGNKTMFRVFCSLENLNPFGDFLPKKDNYTLFDYVKYTEYK